MIFFFFYNDYAILCKLIILLLYDGKKWKHYCYRYGKSFNLEFLDWNAHSQNP